MVIFIFNDVYLLLLHWVSAAVLGLSLVAGSRGCSCLPWPGAKLGELEDILKAKEVDVLSDEGNEFVEKVDSYIRDGEDGGVAPDSGGLLKMKEQLESMGLHVEYKLFLMPNVGTFVAIWKDKSGFGPLYVEVTATERDELEE